MVCLSTQFGHLGDGHGGRTPTVLTKQPVTDKDVGIAHRTWPMGSVVLVENLRTGRAVFARVIDRGPYGKLSPDGRWFNARKKRKKKGKFRGCADLTPALAVLLLHNRKEQVRITLFKWPKKLRQ